MEVDAYRVPREEAPPAAAASRREDNMIKTSDATESNGGLNRVGFIRFRFKMHLLALLVLFKAIQDNYITTPMMIVSFEEEMFDFEWLFG